MQTSIPSLMKPSVNAKDAGSARRGGPARASAQIKNRSFPWKSLLLGLICLIIGIGAGVLIMRQRSKSREVVVAVNGAIINKDEFFAQLERAAGQPVMRKLINDELYVQFARQKGVAPSEADILAAYKGMDTGTAPKEAQPPAEIHRALQVSLSEAAVLDKGITVTEEEIRRFYDQNSSRANPKALYFHPASAQIAVIVTSKEANCAAALDAMSKGLSFGEAAKKYSEDTSKSNSGVLPPIYQTVVGTPKSPELEKTVFSLKIGGQIGPQAFAGKWWIIRCLDKKQEVTEPFEKVREQARMGALLAKGVPQNAKQTEKDFAEFQKKANIQAFWKQYQVTGSAK